MTEQTVSDVMSGTATVVAPTATLTEAARLMRDHDVGDVIVTQDGTVRGVLTDRDIVVRGIAEGLAANAAVGDISSENLVVTRPETPAEEAAQLMRDSAVRRLPVVDGDGTPRGLVSLSDLAVTRDRDSALADISAAPPNL